MSLDPYAPPLSPMNGQTPADMANTGLRYSTFWGRVGAGLIDLIFISPLLIMNFMMGDSQAFYLYSVVLTQLVTLFFYVYLVTKFGATPGKLALGLRISMLDGSPVTVQAACLRYGMWWILGLLSGIGMVIAASAVPADSLVTGYLERTNVLAAELPFWGAWASYATQALGLASLVVMLISKERRTLHDFLAGTVVVRKK